MTSPWRKARRSNDQGANCVEARSNDENSEAEEFEIRDSKLGEESPIFGVSVEDFQSLLRVAQR
jgi:hypothetical protein